MEESPSRSTFPNRETSPWSVRTSELKLVLPAVTFSVIALAMPSVVFRGALTSMRSVASMLIVPFVLMAWLTITSTGGSMATPPDPIVVTPSNVTFPPRPAVMSRRPEPPIVRLRSMFTSPPFVSISSTRPSANVLSVVSKSTFTAPADASSFNVPMFNVLPADTLLTRIRVVFVLPIMRVPPVEILPSSASATLKLPPIAVPTPTCRSAEGDKVMFPSPALSLSPAVVLRIRSVAPRAMVPFPAVEFSIPAAPTVRLPPVERRSIPVSVSVTTLCATVIAPVVSMSKLFADQSPPVVNVPVTFRAAGPMFAVSVAFRFLAFWMVRPSELPADAVSTSTSVNNAWPDEPIWPFVPLFAARMAAPPVALIVPVPSVVMLPVWAVMLIVPLPSPAVPVVAFVLRMLLLTSTSPPVALIVTSPFERALTILSIVIVSLPVSVMSLAVVERPSMVLTFPTVRVPLLARKISPSVAD